MKFHDKLIYIVGTISTILLGLLIIGGMALFMIDRIDAANRTHSAREEQRLSEKGGHTEDEESPEVTIENVTYTRVSGSIDWTASDGSQGTVVFYVNNDGSIGFSDHRSDYPQNVRYHNKMMAAAEEAVEDYR